MSKAAELAALIGSQTALSNRNLVINGAMQVFQRATSATNPGGGYDAADRWRQSQNSSGLGNFTIEQSTDAPDGFATSLKLTKSGTTTQSANLSAYIEQYFEGQNLQQLQYGGSGAKKVTLSFYVKSSLTGTWGVCLQDGEAGRHNAQTYTISSANTWEYKTVTFDGDTAGGIANDNSAEFDVQFVLGAGTSYQTATTNTWASGNKKTTSSQTQWPETDGATWLVTGVQLEIGEQATPFEHRSFGDELRSCQRYCFQLDGGDYAGVGIKDSNMEVFFPFPTTMRSQPTVHFSGTLSDYTIRSGGTDRTPTTFSQLGIRDLHYGWIRIHNSSVGTVGYVTGNSDGFIRFDSEL